MSLYSGSKENVGYQENTSVALNAILIQLPTASGIDRRVRLDELKELLSKENDHDALLACLRFSAGDVQRIALEQILQCDPIESLQAAELLSTLFGILKRMTNTGSNPPSLSSCRTCASIFRVLAYIFNNSDPSTLSEFDIPYIVATSTKSLRWGMDDILLARSLQNQVTVRPSPGNAFAFSNRNRHKPTVLEENKKGSTSSSYRLHKQSSFSSLKSISPSIASAGWESESGVSASEKEGEEDLEKRMASACRTVRSQSMQILETLNAKMAKSLLLHWPRILCESNNEYACLLDIVEVDPIISNRISACRTIESFLISGNTLGVFSGAEERTKLSAFTSLSSRIALIVVQIRTRLLKALQADCAIPVKEAVIRCTTTLVETTTKAKLRQSHAASVRPTALQLCSSTNSIIAVRAHTLLSKLMTTDDEKALSIMHDNGKVGENLLNVLKKEGADPKLKAQAWTAFTAMKGMEATDDGDQILASLALEQMHSNSDELRQAISSYILAIIKYDAKGVVWEKHIDCMQTDKFPPIRAIAADCLSIVEVEGDSIARLCRDEDSSVRAAAVRAIGVSIQTENRSFHIPVIKAGIKDPSALVRQRASWSMGNLCEVTSDLQLLSDCLILRNDDERIVVHAIRGLGALLEEAELNALENQSKAILQALEWTQDILDVSKDPKVRWNTCACLARVFSNGNRDAVQYLINAASKGPVNLPLALANVVRQDKMFKTRLSASTALVSLLEARSITELPINTITTLRQRIHDAKERISTEVERAPFKELQLHVIPLQKSIEKLSDLLNEDN